MTTQENDMASTIVPKSDQINADDLIGGPMTITISDVKIRSGEDQPVSIGIMGSNKVYRPCKSMCRIMVAAWGADANHYVGRSLTLYRDPTVTWGGVAVGGIRVSHMSHLDRDLNTMLTMTKSKRAPYRVKVMPMQKAADEMPPASPAVNAEDAMAKARGMTRLGTDAFRAWWSGDGKPLQQLCAPIIDELRDLCAKADATGGSEHHPEETDS